ncbi:MAG TPA: hypothetical protein DEH00_00875 [Candidatus Marinimicrobia bacterium]|nr:hypothetical protein [Candidatus Neomarinimicrobiota bacterium]
MIMKFAKGLSIGLAIVLMAGVAWGQTELLVNGGFELWDNSTTPTGWDHVENITQEGTEVRSGSYSAKHVGGTKDLGQYISGITAGASYTITIWCKVESGDDSDARLWSYWRSSGSNIGSAIESPYFSATDHSNWSSYTVTLDAPSSADEFYFEVRTYSGATVYWDDFSFVENPLSSDPEPSNHVSSFTAVADNHNSITLTWNDNDGDQPAHGFLVGLTTDSENTFEPVDGTPVADSDGPPDWTRNVTHGTETVTITGLDPETQYYAKIWPYTNSGDDIDYKTDGTVPTASATTTAAPEIPKLIISEVADPKDNTDARFIEIYNNSGGTVNFSNQTWYLSRQANGSTWVDLQLTGALSHGEIFVIGFGADYTKFRNAYGFDPDMSSGFISGNGNDGYFLYYGGDHTSGVLVDAYGVINEDGTGKAWEYTDSRAVRGLNQTVSQGNPTWTASEWTISKANVADCTPGVLDTDQSLPVTLSSFTAKTVKGTVVLEWETSAEVENQGFVLSRQSTVGGRDGFETRPAVIASFATDDALKGQGSTTETTQYRYMDTGVELGKTYIYTLADVDYSGKETILKKVEVKVEAEGAVVADGYALSPVYPNPFNATLTVPFTLTERMNVSIELYSLIGQRIMTVVDREFSAGSYNYTVQAGDLASGIYLVRTSFGKKTYMHKAVLLK